MYRCMISPCWVNVECPSPAVIDVRQRHCEAYERPYLMDVKSHCYKDFIQGILQTSWTMGIDLPRISDMTRKWLWIASCYYKTWVLFLCTCSAAKLTGLYVNFSKIKVAELCLVNGTGNTVWYAFKWIFGGTKTQSIVKVKWPESWEQLSDQTHYIDVKENPGSVFNCTFVS